ncbi:HNH endonuclease [Castellaniella sp. MT123]|uniref:HNH endonuclease n=1 Tax=Castellaniella sp. MT123 TaxID=3140381 RepID=UPI0031F3BD45
MNSPIPLLERTRLEKAAQDAGFDLRSQEEGSWLVFRSTAFSQALGVAATSQGGYRLGLTDSSVCRQIAAELGLQVSIQSEPWSVGLEGAADYEKLYHSIDRAADMFRVMAGIGLQHYRERTHTPPDATEISRLVRQRIGQDIFRATLIEYWGGRCALTSLDEPQLLRASHIKPWARCETDEERLDVFNGFLLAPHFDALFDAGWITFLDSGAIQVSPSLQLLQRKALGLHGNEALHSLSDAHLPYLAWHRKHWFRK